MRLLFAAALFVGAALLFLVQPMLARMVLPLLGGAPAVWNTCMVFFEAALLAGYAYAHAAPAWLGVRRHALLHVVLLLSPLLVLPLGLPRGRPSPDDYHPIVWLLGVLTATAGLPFVVLAAGGPLLQRWFAHTGSPAARDPYFLYSASNLGSILGLLAYPFLLEPTLSLTNQSRLWEFGYALLVILSAACAACLWRAPTVRAGSVSDGRKPSLTLPAPTALRRARWVVLAFAPSSLMLSVTAYLTTDVAAVPLLWVAPLTLYLLTFVLAFARRPFLSPAVLGRWTPLVVLPVVLTLLAQGAELPALPLIALHLLGLFWIGLLCHSELARDRPAGERLTEFYLWLSFGGVLGGVFNGLLAPVLFSSVLEYPLVLVLACCLRPAPAAASPRAADRRLDGMLPLALGLLTAGLVLGVQAAGVAPGPLSVALMFGAPLVVCYTFLHRPLRFGLGVAALLLAGGLYSGAYGRTELLVRSFFAVHRVTLDPAGRFRQLVHGDTVHGRQSVRPDEAREPLTYYHRTGPAGQMFAALHYNQPDKRDPRLRRVGVVGLGAGSLCCYAAAGERWTFYEIDPAVEAIACRSGWFTFYPQCPAECDVVLGDARLSLQRSRERFGVLVIDAFSSDAVPVHLLTREALKVYLDRLDDDGVLAFNISNRYLDLETVVADLARDGAPPLACYSQDDRVVSVSEREAGKSPSHWMILARDRAALRGMAGNGGWRDATGRATGPAWTDDYSNLLSVLKPPDFGAED